MKSTRDLAERALALQAFAQSLASGRDPDDLVQDTALAALQSEGAPAAPDPWLRRVLRNHARQRDRAERRRLARDTTLVVDAPAPDPELDQLRAQLLATLGQALAELDQPYQHTLGQRFIAGLSAAEIARRSGIPASTIRSRIHHAIEKLRRRLDERFGGRAQWFPALVLLAAPDFGAAGTAAVASSPSSSATPRALEALPQPHRSPMPMTAKLIATASVVAIGGVGLVATATPSRPPAEMPPSSIPAHDVASDVQAAPVSTRPDVRASDAVAMDAPSDDFELPPRDRVALDWRPKPSQAWSFVGDLIIPADLDPNRPDVDPEVDKAPVFMRLDGGSPGDLDRIDRLGAFIDCEQLVLGEPMRREPTRKMVAFAYEALGHQTRRMEVVIDEVGRPEVVDCLREAYAELWVEKHEEYPWYDEPNGNVIGAIFGGSAPPAQTCNPDPEEYPLDAAGVWFGTGPDPDAIELVVCGDVDSPFTHQLAETLRDVQAYFQADVTLRWLQAPMLRGEKSLRAVAAIAAHRQNRFWDMHAELMQPGAPESEDELVTLATNLGMDPDLFSDDLHSVSVAEDVRREYATCLAHGAAATPYLFVDGTGVAGAIPFDRVVDLIEQARTTP